MRNGRSIPASIKNSIETWIYKGKNINLRCEMSKKNIEPVNQTALAIKKHY